MNTPEQADTGAEMAHPADQTPAPAQTATLPPPPPSAPTRSAGLAVAALIVGIFAFLFGLIPVFGALVGVTAVVLASLALRKQQSKGMAVAGLVLGAVAVLSSIGMAAGIGAAVNNASNDSTTTVIAEPEVPEVDETDPVEPVAPEPEQEVEEPATPSVPVEFNSALNKAQSYSDMMHMSKAGLYDQLTSQYGEKFSAEAAQYAVDNVSADWNANALAKAKSYQDMMSMSPEAIRDQLTSEYGEKFTAAEADHAVKNLNG